MPIQQGLGVEGFLEESMVTFGRVNPRKTQRRALFRFLRTSENSKQNPADYDASLHARGISEFATTYPSTNDYPFDFAQSLLLLHKGGVESVVLRVGEALLVSGLVFVYLASRGRTELVGNDNMDGLFFVILCCRLFLILSNWPTPVCFAKSEKTRGPRRLLLL